MRYVGILAALVMALVLGCGEAEPPTTGEPPGAGMGTQQESIVVVVDQRPAETSQLPGCDRLALPADVQVVVPLEDHGDFAVVYENHQAVCSAPVTTLHTIGVLTGGDWFRVASLFGIQVMNPRGSSDPIPAHEKSDDVSSSDPIPAFDDGSSSGSGSKVRQ